MASKNSRPSYILIKYILKISKYSTDCKLESKKKHCDHHVFTIVLPHLWEMILKKYGATHYNLFNIFMP